MRDTMPRPEWSDRRVARLAASRFGLTNPSPDDVLMGACPDYHKDDAHTARYHRLFEEALRLAGVEDHGERWRQTVPKQVREMPTKVCPCGKTFSRASNESDRRWAIRRWCSRGCYNAARRIAIGAIRDARAMGEPVTRIAANSGVSVAGIYAALKRTRTAEMTQCK